MATLGGVFLASREPSALMDWFESRFGFRFQRHGDGGSVSLAMKDGVAVFGIQQAREDAPAPPHGAVVAEPYGRQPMMINVRVESVDDAIRALTDAGDEVAGPEVYDGFGTFAWTRTPDGHDVEIWQATSP